MKPIWLAVPALFCLHACSAQTPSPPPTVEPVHIAITPTLAPLRIALQACATTQAGTSLQVETVPASQLNYETSDLVFRLGFSDPLPAFSVPIAGERMQVVVHPALNISQLDRKELDQLFSGQVRNWAVLGGMEMDVVVWLPPPGADQRIIFDTQFLSGSHTSPMARFAPNPQAMLEAVAETPGSIGYLPGAWDVAALTRIDLPLITPVLALSARDPTGPAYRLLVCLQSQAGQQILSQHYIPLAELEP